MNACVTPKLAICPNRRSAQIGDLGGPITQIADLGGIPNRSPTWVILPHKYSTGDHVQLETGANQNQTQGLHAVATLHGAYDHRA